MFFSELRYIFDLLIIPLTLSRPRKGIRVPSTQQLEQSAEHRSKLLIDSVAGCAYYMLDTDGIVTSWNTGAQRAKGYAADEIIGRHFSTFYSSEDLVTGEPARALQTALAKGRYETEGWRLRKDGTRFWASVIVEPVHEADQHIGFVKVTRDITRDHQAEEQLAHTNKILDLALSNMSQGIALFDSTETLILANEQYSKLTGIQPGAARPGMKLQEILQIGLGAEAENRCKWIRERRASGQTSEFLTIKGETDRTVAVSEQLLPDGGWVATFEDVTERKNAEQTLERIAHYDALTGIPNRALFREFLKKAIGQSKRGNKCALFSIDINRFRSVKNVYGHRVGDELLKAVARRLQNSTRDGDMVARVGGDEFVLLQTGIAGAKDAEAMAIRVLEVLRLPFQIETHEILIDSSIGIALAPQDGVEADELNRKADLALYRAKKANRAGYNFFEQKLEVHLETQRTVEQDLRQALRRDELELFYQGLIDVKSESIVGYEALLRWRHPLRGMVSPAEFIPTAEESGLIVEIGNWALHTALRQAASWPDYVKIAVNLSPAQLRNESFIQFVKDALSCAGVKPNRLEFEITESTLMDGDDGIMSTLGQLQTLGVRIALDDFGTGFSSLSYLRNFQFDRLKIDRSFVQDLASNEPSRVLTRAIAGLGASFGMAVTGEGVESRAQFDYLRAMGCSEVQGFYFSRPKPVSDMKEELRNCFVQRCVV
jgi:diguanylate cyclase (GGDEF)-like protein/PAS domain S-box-containing protein